MPDLDYLNFDLQIENAEGGYRTQVLASPAGEARGAVLPLTGLDTTGHPQSVGGQLFDAVFHDEILSCLRRSMDETARQGLGLRIRLRLSTVPDLAALPWEYLYDRGRDSYLALSRETPLVRYLDLPEPPRDIEGQRHLRVLAVIASPQDYPALDAEHEWATLWQALHDLEERGLVTVDRLPQPSLEALQRQLQMHEYHILHFLGHGSFDPEANDSVLILQGPDGRGQVVSGQDFSTLLRDQRSLRLALLNACQGAEASAQDAYTGVAQRLVRGGIPAVIAMRTAISDQAAIAFASSFYGALANGAGVDAALAEARKALFTGCCAEEWGTPVLYMRAPDGDLWPQTEPDTRRGRIKRLLITGLGTALTLALAFGAYLLFVPARMDPQSTLKIAVADIGVLDANGAVQPSPDGALAAGWIASALEAAIGKLEPDSRITVWHSGLPRTQMRARLTAPAGKTAQARAAAAEALAKRVGADVVVYAHLTPEAGAESLVTEFYVSELVRAEANETIGQYTFGEPIALPADLSRADTLVREAVARRVSDRTTALFRLLLGLREDLLGEHAAALTRLQEAEAELTKWGDRGEGKEILYYFMAREAGFLERYDEAQAYAEKAIVLNPDHARAYIALGSTYLGQAQRLPAPQRLEADGPLAQAESAYQRGAALAKSSGDRRMELIAQLALAGGHLVRVAAFYESEDPLLAEQIQPLADRTILEINTLLAALDAINQYRMLGQAYSYLGQLYFLLGNRDQRQGETATAQLAFTEARSNFQECSKLAQKAPEDKTLVERIVRGICEPGLRNVSASMGN